MTPTLYQTLLGAAFFRLPDSLRAMHSAGGHTRYVGRVSLTRGRGLLSRLCGRVAGLPKAMDDAPATVEIDCGPNGEVWRRDFGGRPMQSRLWHHDGQLRERLGGVQLHFLLHTHDGTIYWNVVGARLFGVLPMPVALFRRVRCEEREIEGIYRFQVEARMPLAGSVVRYSGWLRPEADIAPLAADMDDPDAAASAPGATPTRSSRPSSIMGGPFFRSAT
ncbi:DUF4166 domain-containing protein [Luteimonas abyssi]|uniref:DUF4166 domain-containing protein n=1 Tax=Luteimonas abyssi TaxID=1247514 RepID=UPI0009E8E340|nr:DUF4166 domain-containing protein [Luteimonas abyssi]